jgi:ABC-type nitrate/sulfonate/bicarbonate transport system permease component
MKRLLEATGSLLALLALWYALARFGGMSDFLLPGPGLVAERILEDAGTGDLWKSLLRTLQTALTGFAAAGIGGTILGILMARVALVRWFFDPLVSLGFPMPKIAFLPVFLLWLGPTPAAQITIVAVSAIFPVAVAAVAAAEGVEKTWLWSARSLGGTNTGILWQVVLPAITPQIFTGLQIALPVALVTTIVAEMLTGSDGIGGAMLSAMRFADSPGVFAGIIVIAATGMLVIKSLELTRRYLLRWHQEQH